jgi:hypothetical protein
MLARLGDVLYWLACLLALGLIGFIVFAMSTTTRTDAWSELPIWVGIAGLIWLAGRGVRYVLAGR